MKGSVRNYRRVATHSWWVVLGMVVFLTACIVEESDVPIGKDATVGPAPTRHSDWQVPGLVDRSGAQIEVPTPGPATGRTLNVTHFGANPDPRLTRRRSSHPGGPRCGRTG